MKKMGDAFTFLFNDPQWVSKIIIGAVFTLLSVVLIGIPVIYGYYIELLQRVRRNEQYPLPAWTDLGVKFVTGFKYIIALIIYYLPIMIIAIPFFLMLFVSALSDAEEATILSGVVFMVFIFVIIIPFSLVVTLLQPIIAVTYAERESIGDALKVGTIFRLFKQRWQDTLVATLITIGIGLLASIGILFFLFGLFVTTFYVRLVEFHLYGQIAQSIDERKTPAQAAFAP
jgi:hypothetical protein